MGTTNVSSQLGELLPLTFVPALAASFGIQPVLVGSGVGLTMVALLAYREGVRVDRLRAREAAEPALPQIVDEPVTPNP
jgi:hypothetical protein